MKSNVEELRVGDVIEYNGVRAKITDLDLDGEKAVITIRKGSNKSLEKIKADYGEEFTIIENFILRAYL